MNIEERIAKLEAFEALLTAWGKKHDDQTRKAINHEIVWVRREVIEAGCFHTVTIGPPPAIGGLIMRNIDPFDMIFEAPYLMSMVPNIRDMVEKTIGVLRAGPPPDKAVVQTDPDVQKGYAFIAMPIVPGDSATEDVLDAIKEAAKRCGIHAERVDEPHSNERITDRILESIRKAEYVIVDLTDTRPNVFYEAGYAQALKKTPIYIARDGTKLEFDLKDYPVIFFKGIKELKDKLESRIRGISGHRPQADA
jgi:hypothetical protein